jgi:hypothetical protein
MARLVSLTSDGNRQDVGLSPLFVRSARDAGKKYMPTRRGDVAV